MARVTSKATPTRRARATKANTATVEKKARRAATPKARTSETTSRRTKVAPAPRRTKAAPTSRKSRQPREAAVTTQDEEVVVSGRRNKRKEIAEAVEAIFNPLSNIDDQLDAIEKDYTLSGSSMNPNEVRQSTGLLVLDLILGGGLMPGWYTFFGPEQSCKSTGASTLLGAALPSEVPVISIFDFEGSVSHEYMSNIIKTQGFGMDIKHVFGLKDNTGNWTVKPRVRYYAEGVAEKFFDYLASLERKLPDKVCINDKWWLIYENTKVNQKMLSGHYDTKYLTKTGKLRVPAKDGTLQAMVILDSYPAMLPERLDVDDPGSGMAAQARMFSEQLRRVKGKLRAKRIAVVGVNQLRKAPAVQYGNPEYEPGGEALKFFCFSADSYLQTGSGLLTADEVYHSRKVPQLLGQSGLEQPKPYEAMGISKIVRVTTDLGFEVRGKPGHRVLALRAGQQTPDWVRIDSIQAQSKGEYYVPIKVGAEVYPDQVQTLKFKFVSAQQGTNTLNPLPREIVVDENFAELIGLLVSEGYARDNTVVFSNRDKELLKRAEYLFEETLGVKATRITSEVRASCTELVQLLTTLGAGGTLSRWKAVPRCIRSSPKQVQVAFLKGLFAGDGWLAGRDFGYNSVSNVLLEQVQLMLLNMGVVVGRVRYEERYTDHHLEIASNQARTNMMQVLDMPEVRDRFKYLYNFGKLYGSGTAFHELLDLFGLDSGGKNTSNRMDDVVPPIFGWRMDVGAKLKSYIISLSGKRKHLRFSDFHEGWKEDAIAWAGSLRTTHEREKNLNAIENIAAFVDYTKSSCIRWAKVVTVSVGKEQPTYDCNMPDTHTVVTNGVVSHNSDVRLRVFPRALSSVPGAKGKGQIEEEPSISENGGKDTYRYIHVRAHKNKLSVPNLEGWLRLWITDGDGEARGFDPVWDTYQYMVQTGQISGKRASLRLSLNGKEVPKKAVSWLQLKALVIGTRENKLQVFKTSLSDLKPFDLRAFCRKQLHSGKGLELFFNHIKSDVEEPDEQD